MNPSLEQLAGARTLVVGDLMLDRYLHGSVARISPEAPVPIVKLEGESCCLGGMGNVAAALAALGGEVTAMAVVGDDANAADIERLLAEVGVRHARLSKRSEVQTICKSRVVVGKFHQLLRIDHDGNRDAVERGAVEQLPQIIAEISRHDVVVLPDYEKGNLPEGVVRAIVAECRRVQVPCIADTKKADFSCYAGATMLTPNVHELERAAGCSLESDEQLHATAESIRQQLGLRHLVVTLGPRGMLLLNEGGISHIASLVREVADVTGAGDTVTSVLSLCLARGWDLLEACRLASMAAGIAVSMPRTYVVRLSELRQAWGGRSRKILDRDAAAERVIQAQQSGKRVVFTNGCFDILHAGHLACLEQARAQGDLLVLGLNSDESVRALKGPTRPAMAEEYRAALLAGLECVDLVVVFPESTPEALIRCLNPDILVKGGDYSVDQVVGGKYILDRGGRVVTIPLVEGLSTSNILRQAGK